MLRSIGKQSGCNAGMQLLLLLARRWLKSLLLIAAAPAQW